MKGKEATEHNKYLIESSKLLKRLLIDDKDNNIAITGDGWIVTKEKHQLLSRFTGYPEGNEVETAVVIGKIRDNKVLDLSADDIRDLQSNYINYIQQFLFSEIIDSSSHKEALKAMRYDVSGIPDFNSE